MTDFEKQFRDFKNGVITGKEWDKICSDILEELLDMNKDVLIRLKNI